MWSPPYPRWVVTSLGMPALPPRPPAPPWRTAWDTALYGTDGFFRRSSPADHFRTAVHGNDLLATALLRVVRDAGLDTVVDLGAGRGELLVALHRLAPDLRLVGVEVAPRPAELPDSVVWAAGLPARFSGLVVAHEWLDNIPCHVVEVDPQGAPRLVHVDPDTGRESLGHRLDEPGVPPTLRAWLDRWWPLDGAPPGTRAEVGSTRDRAWADVVRRVDHGIALAVDYGHVLGERPAGGSLASYLHGRQVEVLPDGSRDVTAHVAVDAVADAVGGRVLRQRDVLHRLGVEAGLPALAQAEEDPSGYVRGLARAGAAAYLTAPGGLGGFSWVVSATDGVHVDLG